jgi:hypothetical protein
MSPSSSANKVARVASRSGGSGRPAGPKPSSQRTWLFPVAIVAIIVAGVAIVVFARAENTGSTNNTTKPRAQLTQGQPADHWHAAFGINVCGKELPALPQFESAQGIHTHGDGLIHIHPFEVRAAGKGATIGRFLKGAGVELNNTSFHITGQKEKYEAGVTTCSGKPTELVLANWKRGITAESTPPTQVLHGDFGKERFTGDLAAYTLALVPKGTPDKAIPPPSASASVAALGTCDGANPDQTICGGATQAPGGSGIGAGGPGAGGPGAGGPGAGGPGAGGPAAGGSGGPGAGSSGGKSGAGGVPSGSGR